MTDQPPDYRFTLANERTFLAWVRTSLALLAAAVALVQLTSGLGPTWWRVAGGVLLGVLAILTAVSGLWRWRRVEDSLRRGTSLPSLRVPWILAGGLTAVAIAITVAIVVDALS